MLHIVWIVLKLILIVLGIILGLLLLALLLILFCPVRYRAEISKEQQDWKLTEGRAGISWLFRGISFKVQYENGETGFSVCIFGIPVDRFLKKKKEKPKDREDGPDETKSTDVDAIEESTEDTINPEEFFGEESTYTPEEEIEKNQGGDRLFSGFLGKLTEIRTKIHNIGLTFQKIHDKMDWWKKFVHHPRTQEAISLVWKYAKYLVRHILPTKVEGNVMFGSENPAVTGKVLALLGMSIPFHKNCIAVTPVFDCVNIVEGNIRLKGRIYGVVLVRAAAAVYFNKNIKYVINRIKHRNHKEG